MSDTNTSPTTPDKELYELCKQVYEATGWEEKLGVLEIMAVGKKGEFLAVVNKGEFNLGEFDHFNPLYTSDYLLEKLPVHIDKDRANHLLLYAETTYPYTKNDYIALYHRSEYQEYSSTPLKALLKLTLALKQNGVL